MGRAAVSGRRGGRERGAIKAARIGPGAAIGTEAGGIAVSGSFASQANFKLF